MKRPGDGDRVQRHCEGGWEWFRVSEEPPYQITGKYMFFSINRALLVRIALKELRSGGFHKAKITPNGSQVEHLLCLYYSDDSRRHELAERYRDRDGLKYRDRPELKYRYWKSDEATRRGEYSELYLRRFNGSMWDE